MVFLIWFLIELTARSSGPNLGASSSAPQYYTGNSLSAPAQFYLENSFARGTTATYRNNIQRFCDYQGISLHELQGKLPVSPGVLAEYAVFLLHGGRRPNTIASYISALAHLHTRSGFPSPVSMEPLVSVILGMTRVHGTNAVRPRFTITFQHLDLLGRASRNALSSATSSEARMGLRAAWAWISISFFGMLRNTEGVPANCAEAQLRFPTFQDCRVVLHSGLHLTLLSAITSQRPSHDEVAYLHLFLAHSKADRAGTGTWVIISTQAFPPLSEFLRLHPKGTGFDESTPLFPTSTVVRVGARRYKFEPYTVAQLRPIVRGLLAAAHIDTTGTVGFSFRAGAATHLALRGISSAIIQRLGRWSSEAYRRYVRPEETSLAETMRNAFNSSS